jgi:hypothetical protein
MNSPGKALERSAADEEKRYHYGWSVVSCLPGAIGDPQTAATGAVLRVGTLRRYAQEAGYRAVEVLPIETATWRSIAYIRDGWQRWRARQPWCTRRR